MCLNTQTARLAPAHRSRAKRLSRGFSIVEMMVGVAIGLFLLSGASVLFIKNIGNSRLLLIQARMDQDMRSTMDLITRDLRRGAYWGNALSGTTTTGATAAANPYSSVVISGTALAPEIGYKYANNLDDTGATVLARTFGFKLDSVSETIQMNAGGANWQTLTDSNILRITTFTITPTTTAIDISSACTKACTGVSCPSITVRTYNIVLVGTSKIDVGVTRRLETQVRVRNDALAGVCPA
jgi:prepilin-type N-terminal cleavage/methylation domain-containing protein